MADSSHPIADLVIRLYPELVTRLRARFAGLDPEDLVHELYLRMRRLNGAEIEKPRSYILRAADNLAMDAYRKGGRVQTGEELSEHPDPTPSVEERIDVERRLAVIRTAVEQLPHRQRDAFILAKYHGLTQEQIATRMGISRSAVEKLLVKALVRCREAVEEFS